MTNLTVGDVIKRAKVEKCGHNSYPVLSMTMHDGIVFQGDRFKKQIASVDQSSYNVVRRKQLVVSFPIDEGVLAVQDIADAGIVSPAYKIWDIDESLVVPKYLELFLRSPHSIQYYKAKLKGSTARRRSITDGDFLGMELPSHSLSEQARIIETVEKLTGVRERLERRALDLDDLVKSEFVEMFGDPMLDVSETTLGQIASMKAGVTTTSASIADENDGTLYPCYGGNGLRGYSEQYTHEGVFPLIGRQGALCGNVKLAKGKFRATEHAVVVDPVDTVDPIWLSHYLEYDQLGRLATGAAQPGLSVKELKALPVTVPSENDQRAFVAFVAQVDKSRFAVQQAIDKLELLKAALMQEYFG